MTSGYVLTSGCSSVRGKMKTVMVIPVAFQVTVILRTSTFLNMIDSEEGSMKSDEPYDECYPYCGW
jgi:hypothetical protein